MLSAIRTNKAPIRASAIALSALLASSCASINQELLEAQLPDMPEAWSAEAQAATPLTGDWVAAFNDDTL